MDSERIREQIRENAAEIVRLHSRIQETYLNPEKLREWEQACAEFHSRYDRLAFPTLVSGRRRIKAHSVWRPRSDGSGHLFLGSPTIFLPVGLYVRRSVSAVPTFERPPISRSRDTSGAQRLANWPLNLGEKF
jgi:hypothetical protein